MGAVYDSDNKTVTILSNKLSSYALTYKDTTTEPFNEPEDYHSPKTGVE